MAWFEPYLYPGCWLSIVRRGLKMMNRIGESGSPCLTPFAILIQLHDKINVLFGEMIVYKSLFNCFVRDRVHGEDVGVSGQAFAKSCLGG
jgi:hypothetical protein